MDPFTFATLVGLLATYQSRRDKTKTDNLEEFKAWLAESRHDSLVASLESNTELSTSIQRFLTQSHEAVLGQLSSIEKTLLGVASRMEGLSGIASSVNPAEKLSDQAIAILKDIEEHQAGEFIIDYMGPHLTLLYLGGTGGTFTPPEQRFAKSDLEDLIRCDYLFESGFNSNGKQKLSVTRQASIFVSQLEEF